MHRFYQMKLDNILKDHPHLVSEVVVVFQGHYNEMTAITTTDFLELYKARTNKDFVIADPGCLNLFLRDLPNIYYYFSPFEQQYEFFMKVPHSLSTNWAKF